MVKQVLAHIEQLKTQLEKLQPLSAENQQRLDKKFRLEWNYNSNHMEGNTLTYNETELLLIFDQTKGNHELREYEEMKGHDVALKLVYDLVEDKERTLNENFIRQLNNLLLVRPFFKEAITPDGQPTRREIKVGEYKSFPNSVRLQNGEIFHYPSPAETPALMGDLIEWYKNNTDDAVIVAADLHYKFVCIHPFDDGNGRIARLLMNYHLLKNNLPPVVIKSEDKKNYLRALQEADAGDLDSLRTYIAEKLVWSLELSIKAAKGENIDELGDWDKKLDLLKKGFKEENKITEKKSVETNKHTLEEVVLSFINVLLNKIEKISTLFIENTVQFKSNIGGTNKLKNLDEFKNFSNTIIQAGNTETFEKFSVIHYLEGYKHNGLDTFHLEFNYLIRLGSYSYTITLATNPNFKIENPYLNELSEQDFDSIAKEITETLLKKVAETKL
jgi:Fic family protein